MCSGGRQVNLRFNQLLINLLELRAKWMLVCIRYIEVLDRGLVPTLVVGADLRIVETSRITASLNL